MAVKVIEVAFGWRIVDADTEEMRLFSLSERRANEWAALVNGGMGMEDATNRVYKGVTLPYERIAPRPGPK